MMDRFRVQKKETASKGKEALQNLFAKSERPKVGQVEGIEQPFTMVFNSLDSTFIGIIDLIAEVEGKRTIFDFKTAARSYENHEVVLSDQLVGYSITDPNIEQCGYCILIKSKQPKIQWQLTHCSSDRMIDYIQKAQSVGKQFPSLRPTRVTNITTIAIVSFYCRRGYWSFFS
jgi:PD-(D/E)XK nuclease superfamily protein